MKQDYLWDKSGESDFEIERLESLLQTFRGRQIEPPALSVQAIRARQTVSKAAPRRRFMFACAAAACLIVFGTIFTAWLVIKNRQSQIALKTTRSNVTVNSGSWSPDAFSATESELVGQQNDQSAQQIKRRQTTRAKLKTKRASSARTTRLPNSTKPTQNEFVAKQEKFINRVRLTAEEHYAYQQLMRALQIASSQLNRVKQKIQNTPQKNSLRS